MISNILLRSPAFSFASFKELAVMLLKVQSTKGAIAKKKLVNEYYESSVEEDKQRIANILTFIRDKPPTKLAGKTLLKFVTERYFNDVDAEQIKEKGVDQLVNQLQDPEENQQDIVQLADVQQLLFYMAEHEGKGSQKEKLDRLAEIMDSMSVDEIRIILRILDRKLRIGLTYKSLTFLKENVQQQQVTQQGEQQNVEQVQPKPTKGRRKAVKKSQQQLGLENDEQARQLQQQNESKPPAKKAAPQKKKAAPKQKSAASKQKQVSVQNPAFDFMLAKGLKNLLDLQKFCVTKDNQKIMADLKYDGQRTLISYKKGEPIQLMSRNKKQQTDRYGPLAKVLQKQLDQRPQITSIKIDGEMVCVDKQGKHMSMQKLISKRGKATLDGNDTTIQVFAFDIIQYNGQQMTQKDLMTRRKLLFETPHIKISEIKQFTFPQQKQNLLQHFKSIVQAGYEGIILKGQDDIYFKNGSRKYWAKMKRGFILDNKGIGNIDVDLIVMGAAFGQGKRKQAFGNFMLGIYHQGKIHPVCKVGTGFTQVQLEELTQMFSKITVKEKPQSYQIPKKLRFANYFKPVYVFKLKADGISRSPIYELDFSQGKGGISLRFPVFQEIRLDKSPEMCQSDQLLDVRQKDDIPEKQQQQSQVNTVEIQKKNTQAVKQSSVLQTKQAKQDKIIEQKQTKKKQQSVVQQKPEVAKIATPIPPTQRKGRKGISQVIKQVKPQQTSASASASTPQTVKTETSASTIANSKQIQHPIVKKENNVQQNSSTQQSNPLKQQSNQSKKQQPQQKISNKSQTLQTKKSVQHTKKSQQKIQLPTGGPSGLAAHLL